MKKLYLHVGAHKSASTTLQRNLRHNSDKFLEQYGIKFFGGAELLNSPILLHFSKLSRGELDEYSFSDSLEVAKSYANENFSYSGMEPFISWEGFLGHSSLDLYKGIYTHVDQVVYSLKEIFCDFDVRVLLISRRQDTFIESCYLQQIKEGRIISFDDFTKPILPERLSWQSIANNFRDEFGENFGFVPFELVKELGTKGFLEASLSLLMNKNINLNSYEVFEKSNSSYSAYGVEVARDLLPKLSKKNRAVVNKILFRELSSDRLEKGRYLSEFNKAVLVSSLKKDNEKLMIDFFEFDNIEVKESIIKFWLGG